MKYIILGCGRVGSAIARSLVDQQHDVVVIDNDPDSLIHLGGDDFAGDFLIGEGMDTGALERAGVETADGFIACTSDDNTNVVIAQIAHRRYHVPRCVVRLFDPDKAAFYGKRGLTVVCPTLRAIRQMVDAVQGNEIEAG